MLRERAIEKNIGIKDGFQLRGREVSRIEGFSDAVFAFSITLLVVSLNVPDTFSQLLDSLKDLPAFAVCFLMIMSVWFWHYRFFRRFGLQDNFTNVLNAVLLFVVLIYVYPLKFLFKFLFRGIFFDSDNRLIGTMINADQIPALLVLYGLGFIAVNCLFTILYIHALGQRDNLELNPVEVVHTEEAIWAFLATICIGVASIAIAIIGGVNYTSWAGWVYLAIIPVRTIQGNLSGKRVRLAQDRLDAELGRQPAQESTAQSKS